MTRRAGDGGSSGGHGNFKFALVSGISIEHMWR